MKFKIKVTDGNSSWWEEYTYDEVTDVESAKVKAITLVDGFNSSLRPHEKKRRYIRVMIIGSEMEIRKHKWKKTNLTTIIKGKTCYDTYTCIACDCQGKRYGLSEYITRFGKFSKDKWRSCRC